MKTSGAVFLVTRFFATNAAVSKPGVFVAATGVLSISNLPTARVGTEVAACVGPPRLKILAGRDFVAPCLWILLARP